MKEKNSEAPKISRRGLFALIGGLALAPVSAATPKTDEDYVTVLKADGSTVRIPKRIAGNAKVLDARVSNKKMLNWIKRNKS